MTANARWGSVQLTCGMMIASGAAILACGCEADQKARAEQDNTALAARQAADASVVAVAEAPTPPPTTSAMSIVEQAQRDVEMILQARAKQQDHVAPLDAASTLAAAGSDLKPRPVQWNDAAWSASAGKQSSQIPSNPIQTTQLADSGETAKPKLVGGESAQPEDPQAPATIAQLGANLEPDRIKNLMIDLARELYAAGAYSQGPLRELAMIAAMSMVDPQRRLEPQALPNLSKPDRELIGNLQAFFADLGAGLASGVDSEQAVLAAANKLRSSLIKEPQLRLKTAALCTRVGGFGDYTPVERLAFLAHSQTRVIVYLEIDDFTSELNQQGEFVTHLSQQLTIYADRDGIPVWKEDWQPAVDRSRNKRQDFFTVQVITIPKALSVGKYQLKVRVRDEKSSAEAESSITFEMVADPKMAAAGK